mgnify:CR=1 FL=1
MVPAIAVTAAFAEGKTVIHSAERLRIKESDRIKTTLAVLSAMGIKTEEKKRVVTLTADEEKLLTALKTLAEGHASELAAAAGIPPFKVKAVLSALEVKGLVTALGGNRYAPV